VIGAASFQAQLFFAQLGQALLVKTVIEQRRAENAWGTVLWQLNEIWPTGGWGSIEYGTTGSATTGQVQGGRWKPLQYFLRRFSFRDHLVAATSDARLLVRSDDAFAPTAATAALSFLHLSSGALERVASAPVALPRGAAATTWLCVSDLAATGAPAGACDSWPVVLRAAGCADDGSDCVALLTLNDTVTGAVLAENFAIASTLYGLALPAATVTAAVGAPAADGTVPVTLTATAAAVFVTLTTTAQGRFSDNALMLAKGTTTVAFVCWGPCDAALLAASLRVEHYAEARARLAPANLTNA